MFCTEKCFFLSLRAYLYNANSMLAQCYILNSILLILTERDLDEKVEECLHIFWLVNYKKKRFIAFVFHFMHTAVAMELSQYLTYQCESHHFVRFIILCQNKRCQKRFVSEPSTERWFWHLFVLCWHKAILIPWICSDTKNIPSCLS